MKMEYISSMPKELAVKRRYGVYQATLAEFVDSGENVARIVDCCEDEVNKIYNSMHQVITRHKLPIAVMKRGSNIYLVRKEAVENA